MDTQPLTKSQLTIYTDTAEAIRSVEAAFPFRVVPYTGLTMGEFLHLRPKWIKWGSGDALSQTNAPVIEIPSEAPCRHIIWDPNAPHTTQREGQCSYCQNMDGDDGVWRNRGEGATRQVPVFQPIAQKALRRWFKTLNRNGVPFSQSGLHYLFEAIESSAPLDREISYSALRYTFIRICGEQGLKKEQITEINPFYRIRKKPREILQNTSTNYTFEFPPGKKLLFIKDEQPITAKKLANYTGNTADTELNFLQNGVELGFLTEDGRYLVNGPGGRPEIHFVLNDHIEPVGNIPCPVVECDCSYRQLNALSRHLKSAHENEQSIE